ncbi:MAG: serine/threonine protein kinase [Myxococcales bacterium]|nr:serine/threonine protein kinase [Myxococcales bacterium]
MAAQASPTAVGSLLNGTYRLERIIAEGGMGVVFEAQHVRLPRRFAVKILGKPVDSDTTATTLTRFRREAEIASTLAHPHIVEVFDYQVAESGAPYLVMELLEGEDLADRLKRGRVNIIATLRIIAEIAEALDVAHTGGVVHRDLKPANIFLTKRGAREDHVKVLDFGVSKLIDSATLTQEKAMVGTPLYMSPEQAVGTQELTPESDIFSLGAICYEMLTGRRAFAASSIPSILYQIVHGPTPRLAGKAPGLSAAVDEVFGRVLAKRKENRYKRATQFAEDLRVALGREEPGDLAPRTLAFDGDSLESLAAAHEPTSDVMGRGAMVTGADDTELDSSTKAEEALAPMSPRPVSGAQTAAGKRAPSSVVFDPASAPNSFDPMSERSYTQELRAGSRRRSSLVLGALALAALAGVVALLQSGTPLLSSPAAAPAAPPAPSGATAATAPAAPMGVAGTTDDEDPPPDKTAAPDKVDKAATPSTRFDPEPVERHPDVQFTFHVFPRGAEILVDDKKIGGTRMTLPYGRDAHRVLVRAPGYHTITTSASSTANRTFELRMDRIVVRTKKVVAPQRPAHDAAPVQDL